MPSFYYIAEGEMFRFADGKAQPVRSEVRDSFTDSVRRKAAQDEWRYQGDGAAFIGTYRPDMNAEARMRAVNARVTCVGEHQGRLLYAMDMGQSGGLYVKAPDADRDGILLCEAHTRYGAFDTLGDYMTYTAAAFGESHIGILNIANKHSQICTEGHVIESSPVFDRADPHRILFCSSGLPVEDAPEDGTPTPPPSYADMVQDMYDASSYEARKGPSALCVLNLENREVTELLSDPRYDYLRPATAADGTLYYIRRPYEAERMSTLGCLADALLFPVRLLGALFGFLNVFSAKYAGKTLSRSDVKHRDERQMRIDGNLVNAERALRENRRDEHPGIIPRTWQLIRRSPDGTEITVKRGVCAFALCEDGTLLVSNGSAVLHMTKDGREDCLLRTEGVTFLKTSE